MEANAAVIEMLSDLLASELAASNTYFLHHKLLDNWGYEPLSKHAREESFSEMRHSERIIERLIYFDQVPNMQRLGRVRGGATVTEQFEQALALEQETIGAIVKGISLCREVGDEGTRLVLEPILTDGEEAIDWLETQLSLIATHGETSYLAEHIQPEG